MESYRSRICPGQDGGAMQRCLLGTLLLLILSAARLLAQDFLHVEPGFDGTRWLEPDAAIELKLNRTPLPQDGRLAVFIGTTDISALLTISANQVTYRPRLRLPPGEQEVSVYLITPANQWQELSRFPIRILHYGGFEKASVTPRIALLNKGQLAEGHAHAAPPPERREFQDFTLNAGIQTLHDRNGWSFALQSNVVGVTHRPEALRFQVDSAASKVDLSDYVATVARGEAAFTIGHVSFGDNRFLASSFASRGALARLKLGPAAQLSLTALNGNSIVGWKNVLGVSNPDNRLLGAELGIELAPARPGLARVVGSAMSGSLLPVASFRQGGVLDAERSRGLGVRVIAATPNQRVRLGAGFARSRFDNPSDPTLEQGLSVVPVRSTTKAARYVDVALDVIRGAKIARSIPVMVGVGYHHERVDPLFRSVAASVRADYVQDGLELNAAFGEITVQASANRAHDNLDDVASILLTRTHAQSLAAALPLGTLAKKAWLPTLTYGYTCTHQYGDHLPQNGDFAGTHVPDQLSENHVLGVQWQGAKWHAGYQFNRSEQDNRQVGRATADFSNFTNNFTLGIAPASAVDLNFDLAYEGADNFEVSQRAATARIAMQSEWRFTRTAAISGAVSGTRVQDEPRTSRQIVTDMHIELTQRVQLGSRAAATSAARTGQVFVRYARQFGEVMPVVGLSERRRTWALNSGVTLTLF